MSLKSGYKKSAHRLPRHVQLVQRDLAHLGLAGLDMGAQQQRGLVAAFVLNGLKDFGMLGIGRIHAGLPGEVEPANHANALGYITVHTCHFSVASSSHQRAMKGFVRLCKLNRVGGALLGADQPDAGKLFKACGAKPCAACLFDTVTCSKLRTIYVNPILYSRLSASAVPMLSGAYLWRSINRCINH